MIRATRVLQDAAGPDRIAGTITLAHGERHRRRMAMTTDGGLSFLLDLGTAAVLEEGQCLELEDGRLIRIRAAPEPLLEIRTDTPLALKKLIWHIGNRHVPAEITRDAIYIAYDHVLVDMLEGLGAEVAIVERPFRPVRGAYHHHEQGGGHHHGHGHG